ncbi:MAG TPA: right-handed parallel beta-helix repeat-containing protein, partial [Ilumatobacteraceae bacterium]|nr:right-handed parallel beta-helix repeat-containing protein [Ilumatobacteraceae bacterium]
MSANKANVTLQGAGIDVSTIVGPIGGAGSTVLVSAAGVVIDGFTVTRAGNNLVDWNNPGLNSGGVSVQSQGNTVELRNSKLVGNRTGVDINNSNGNSIHNNIIDNNRTGMIFRNQTDNTSVMNNFVTNNWTVGILFLDGSGGTNSPPQSALNSTFSNNKISGNWYGQIVDRQTGGALPAPGGSLKNFSSNWYGTTAPVYSTASSAEPGYAAQIPVIYGGAAVPPGGQPDILGLASANFDFTPYLATSTDTAPANGFQGDFSSLYVTAAAAQTGATARVQEGVDAVTPAGTVRVVAGAYAGDTLVAKALNLFGAQQGVAVGGRTFGGPAESTLSGMLTIQAAGVTVDGFSETNVVPSGGVIGFLVKTAGTNAVIANNIFDAISTPDTSSSGLAQAIYLDNGPDGVQILNNAIRNVSSERSAKGILIGDSASSDQSQNVVIQGNRISNIASTSRGGYGILVGNLAGTPNLQVVGNVLDGLSSGSGWVHAIGLERDTPNASVNHNVISNLSTPGLDMVAVWFEDNPSFATVLVNRNILAVGPVALGILRHPALVGGPVNGSCNWW